MRDILLPLAIALAWIASIDCGAESAGDPPPGLRYKLRPGMELVYESNSRIEHKAGFGATKTRAVLCVANPSGPTQWRVAVDLQMIQSGSYSNESYADTNRMVGLIRLSEDGRIAEATTGFFDFLLPEFLVRLPQGQAKAGVEWVVDMGPGDEARHRLVSRVEGKPDEWAIERTEHGVSRDVAASTSRSIIHFDDRRGLLTRIVTEEISRLDEVVTNSVVAELKSLTERSPEWATQMEAEADIAAKAYAEVERLSTEAGKSGVARPTASIRKVLSEARAKVKLPQAAEFLDRELALAVDSGSETATDDKPKESLVGKPAPNWTLKDVDGKEHTLAGYRGKVVLMDFWFRGCGWCIKAMPQLKEVADHFRDKPVIMLGINTDQEVKDARFVVDRLKLNYPNLMGKSLPEKYQVMGFPTLVVVDARGTVVDLHVGYSPTLKEDLIRQVDGLLGKQ